MEESIKYWNIFDYEMSDKVTEDFYRSLKPNKKTRFNVHHYSCSNWRFPKLEIDKEYWIDVSEIYSMVSKYVKCKIIQIN